MPTPGEVDVVIASELMEAGRAVQRGFVTPARTTLIASTNRVYSIAEKSGPADSRVDSDELLAGARQAAKTLVSADFNTLASQARSVISASLLGALAGSGALEFSREQFEQTIRDTGKGVDASLKAFAAGFELAETAVRVAESPTPHDSGKKVFLTRSGRAARGVRDRRGRSGSADHRGGPLDRAVDVLPGHHSGGDAEGAAGSDRRYPRGGLGR